MIRRGLLTFVSVSIGVLLACGLVGAQDNSFTMAEISSFTAPEGSGLILNPEGKGDLLIFPYYDVRQIGGKAQDTYFAIINQTVIDTNGGVVARIRFREWDKSEEVFDADIWLSDNDVWVGVLTRSATTGLTNIFSPDWVVVDFSPTQFFLAKALSPGVDFFSFLAPGGSQNTKTPPTGFTAADLTNMGYFELIGEERTFTKGFQATSTSFRVTRLTQQDPDCPNTLSGYAFIIRVADGVTGAYNATAIANFSRFQGSLFSSPGDVIPRLDDAEDGLAQLEFQLSKANISQGYSIEDVIAGKFSLIVTFPTKHFHFQSRPRYSINTSGSIARPFTGTTANTGEKIAIKIYDREENVFAPPPSPFSPRLTEEQVLPFEVTIIGLYRGSVPSLPAIGQRDTIGLTTGNPGFESGWIWIDLAVLGQSGEHFAFCEPPLCDIPAFEFFGNIFSEYDGLPAIALAYQEFNNAAASGPGVAGFYGAALPVYYDVDWVQAVVQ